MPLGRCWSRDGCDHQAATASTVVGPQATIAAATGAIGPAAKAYGEAFYGCLASISFPDAIRGQIKAVLNHDDKGITDWSGSHHPIRHPYGPQFAYYGYGYF